jgi:hypothetical protein
MAPSKRAKTGVRNAHAGVIATSPATAPEAAPIDVGFCEWFKISPVDVLGRHIVKVSPVDVGVR